jgi:hypothetical protein
MVEQQQACPVGVPAALGQLIALNVEYGVLLCLGGGCSSKAINPAGAVEHLRKKHSTEPNIKPMWPV